MNNNQFLALPNEIMKSDNPLHYEFFNFKNNIDFKVFLMILSISTMLYKDNGLRKQTFTLNGILSRDTYLPRSKLNFEKLESIINNLNLSPFFKSIIVNKSLLNPTNNTEENEEEAIKYALTNSLNKSVELELSDEYLNLINNKNNGFNKIKLEELKSCREAKATKLKVITMMKPKGYLHLNYLLKVLSINCNLNRTDKIRQIKRAFNGINIEFEYKHPKRNKKNEIKPEYYKFHYDTLITEKNNLDDIKF
ncbi:hypothetical protein FXE71_06745 [Vibrio cholerae]|uniref:hypothetical protein n=1 Tax=Vibrio cholerae TaxID=666 RepID=UPI0011D5E0BD|nr:hypothetical protein [Vibrio cholerae]TXZ23715.1 hypothetical protein FXE71_06745 [Vibrio cholerae]GIA46609.1 hypothetical protein VCSRO86_2639 [Vibrio cholerae]